MHKRLKTAMMCNTHMPALQLTPPTYILIVWGFGVLDFQAVHRLTRQQTVWDTFVPALRLTYSLNLELERI